MKKKYKNIKDIVAHKDWKFVYINIAFLFFSSLLYAYEGHEESPHYEWFEANEVAVQEDGIYVDTKKGMMQLNVVEYDRENDRYKVLCTCLERPGLDPGEALSIPYEDTSE